MYSDKIFVSLDYEYNQPTHGVAIKRNVGSHGFIGLSSAGTGLITQKGTHTHRAGTQKPPIRPSQ